MLEPERGHLRQDFSLIGNRRRQDHVESRKAIRGDYQEVLAQIINVANLAASMKFQSGKVGLHHDHKKAPMSDVGMPMPDVR